MADFSIASQVQPVQTPNMLGMLEHVQKMQTSNMLMQQRAAELQKENAIRAAAAQHGVGSQGYINAVARIDPSAALAALTQQRQAAAAGASATASAASAALSRLQGDKVTQELLAKNGDQFVAGLRSLESYPEEQRATIYTKMHDAMPETLKPFFNPIYSPKAVELAQMTAADFVAAAKPTAPTIYPGTVDMAPQAYVPGKNGALGTMSLIPEAPVSTNVPNQLVPPPAAATAVPGTNQLIPPVAAAPTTPSEMRAQAAARAQATELETFKKKEAIKRDMSAELSPVEEQKLRTQVGEARSNASESLATAQGVLDAAKALRAVPDNDKNRILGLSGEHIYNVTDAAKNAQTKFNDIKGQVTGMAKAAAGSIGSMAVQEWKILADQIATLEAKNLTPKALNEQLDIIVHREEGLMLRTKQNNTSTYSPMISRYEGQFDLPEPEPRPAPKTEEAPAAPASRRSTNGRSALPAGVTSSGW